MNKRVIAIRAYQTGILNTMKNFKEEGMTVGDARRKIRFLKLQMKRTYAKMKKIS